MKTTCLGEGGEKRRFAEGDVRWDCLGLNGGPTEKATKNFVFENEARQWPAFYCPNDRGAITRVSGSFGSFGLGALWWGELAFEDDDRSFYMACSDVLKMIENVFQLNITIIMRISSFSFVWGLETFCFKVCWNKNWMFLRSKICCMFVYFILWMETLLSMGNNLNAFKSFFKTQLKKTSLPYFPTKKMWV